MDCERSCTGFFCNWDYRTCWDRVVGMHRITRLEVWFNNSICPFVIVYANYQVKEIKSMSINISLYK